MKRPREIGDNAFIESFFHTLKADVIHGHVFDNAHALRRAISHYTRRYNRTRMQSSLDYARPLTTNASEHEDYHTWVSTKSGQDPQRGRPGCSMRAGSCRPLNRGSLAVQVTSSRA